MAGERNGKMDTHVSGCIKTHPYFAPIKIQGLLDWTKNLLGYINLAVWYFATWNRLFIVITQVIFFFLDAAYVLRLFLSMVSFSNSYFLSAHFYKDAYNIDF